MYGAVIRAGGEALFVALLAAVLSFALEPFITFLGDYADQSDLLYSGLVAVSNNALFAALLGILIWLIARAVVEAQTGVFR
jgi:hypothetical protein